MLVNGIGSWCVLVEYVKDNYYAKFHDPSYHRYRERHLSILVDVKLLMDGRTDELIES